MQNSVFPIFSIDCASPSSDATKIIDLERRLAEATKTIDALKFQIQLDDGYREIVNRCPDGILVHAEGVILFANPSQALLFGVATAQDLIGRKVFDFVAP